MEDDINYEDNFEDDIGEPNMQLANISHRLFMETGNIGYHNFDNLLKASRQELSDYFSSVKQEEEHCLEG